MLRTRRQHLVQPRRTAPLLAGALALAMGLSGCGGDDDPPSAVDQTPPSSATGAVSPSSIPDPTPGPSESTAEDPSSSAPDTGWNEILEAARQEGQVVVYSGDNPAANDRLAAGFAEAYPDISIEIIRGVQYEPMLDQERESGADGADLYIVTTQAWFAERAAEGALLAPVGPHAADWPSEYLVDGAVVQGSINPFVIAYNTDQVPNPPVGFADLLDPQYSGQLASSSVVASVVAGWYDWLETSSPGYIKALAAQQPSFYEGSVPVAQAVAAGEHAIGVFAFPGSVQPLVDEGAGIDYVVPDPTVGTVSNIAALGWAHRPNAALVFLDWVMSPEGQQAWNGVGVTASPLEGIPGELEVANLEILDLLPWTAERMEDFTAEWGSSLGG